MSCQTLNLNKWNACVHRKGDKTGSQIVWCTFHASNGRILFDNVLYRLIADALTCGVIAANKSMKNVTLWTIIQTTNAFQIRMQCSEHVWTDWNVTPFI